MRLLALGADNPIRNRQRADGARRRRTGSNFADAIGVDAGLDDGRSVLST